MYQHAYTRVVDWTSVKSEALEVAELIAIWQFIAIGKVSQPFPESVNDMDLRSILLYIKGFKA
jgi:hypothetical protein